MSFLPISSSLISFSFFGPALELFVLFLQAPHHGRRLSDRSPQLFTAAAAGPAPPRLVAEGFEAPEAQKEPIIQVGAL